MIKIVFDYMTNGCDDDDDDDDASDDVVRPIG